MLLPKAELKRQLARFCADMDRGISIGLFADVCGIDRRLFERVFIEDAMPMTENTQRLASRGYELWKAGAIRVMQHKRKRWAELRRDPRSPILPAMAVHIEHGRIALRVGPANRHDYGRTTLAEQLRR